MGETDRKLFRVVRWPVGVRKQKVVVKRKCGALLFRLRQFYLFPFPLRERGGVSVSEHRRAEVKLSESESVRTNSSGTGVKPRELK